jgi:hypothetical protein
MSDRWDLDHLVRIRGCTPALFKNLTENQQNTIETKMNSIQKIIYIASWSPHWFVYWTDNSVSWQTEAQVFKYINLKYKKLAMMNEFKEIKIEVTATNIANT